MSGSTASTRTTGRANTSRTTASRTTERVLCAFPAVVDSDPVAVGTRSTESVSLTDAPESAGRDTLAIDDEPAGPVTVATRDDSRPGRRPSATAPRTASVAWSVRWPWPVRRGWPLCGRRRPCDWGQRSSPATELDVTASPDTPRFSRWRATCPARVLRSCARALHGLLPVEPRRSARRRWTARVWSGVVRGRPPAGRPRPARRASRL